MVLYNNICRRAGIAGGKERKILDMLDKLVTGRKCEMVMYIKKFGSVENINGTRL